MNQLLANRAPCCTPIVWSQIYGSIPDIHHGVWRAFCIRGKGLWLWLIIHYNNPFNLYIIIIHIVNLFLIKPTFILNFLQEPIQNGTSKIPSLTRGAPMPPGRSMSLASSKPSAGSVNGSVASATSPILSIEAGKWGCNGLRLSWFNLAV